MDDASIGLSNLRRSWYSSEKGPAICIKTIRVLTPFLFTDQSFGPERFYPARLIILMFFAYSSSDKSSSLLMVT